MKTILSNARPGVRALLAAVTLTLLFGAAAQAQLRHIIPFVDCVEQEYAGGTATGNYIAYFGYSSENITPYAFYAGGAYNNFFPRESPQNDVSIFYPGVHPRVISIIVPIGTEETWYLGSGEVTASFRYSNLCAADGANSRLITYQGKLSDGAVAASGAYDLRFQLFNQLTGGTERTTQIALDNVPVTNGVFTVQLDLGANSLPPGSSGTPAPNLKLNPAILDAENSFFEIAVRAGTSTGAYTTLTPRQPITAVPLAMRANTANNAFRAAFADVTRRVSINNAYPQYCSANSDYGAISANTSNGILSVCTETGFKAVGVYSGTDFILNTSTRQSGSFNISGNGTIGGSLVTGGTITSGCKSGFTAIANGRLCVSAMQTAATFYGANGAVQICTNLGARVGNSADAMLTFSNSGFNYFGGTSSGWLADNLGDDIRATWNVSAPAPNFDGAPVNVFTTTTSLPFRCVY